MKREPTKSRLVGVVAWAVVVLIPGAVMAQWEKVSEGGELIWEIKRDTLNEVSGISVVGKKSDLVKKTIELRRLQVGAEDCRKQFGTLTIKELSGETILRTGFAFGAGNVGSEIAERLCRIAEEAQAVREWKDAEFMAFREFKKLGYDYKANGELLAIYNKHLKRLGSDSANEKRSAQWFLQAAHELTVAELEGKGS